jgi:hypothetical protein
VRTHLRPHDVAGEERTPPAPAAAPRPTSLYGPQPPTGTRGFAAETVP